ncbi:MAG: YggS family pyridoxal phosphate-dependent enzyme [Candidatus Aureabacteria bacterium]|nr:YggS family pyridoxal phosphate-dependent enzyme [Candidatus Auribacterota bacterium]
MSSIQENYRRVKETIMSLLARSGRPENDCLLVAASKYAGLEKMQVLLNLGHRDFGENRVQDAERKSFFLLNEFPDIRWHMIGHLQSNKAGKAVSVFTSIQTVDSEKLARKLDNMAAQMDKKMPVLIQVNASGEETKSGVSPEELDSLLNVLIYLQHIDVQGLMTMPPYSEDPEDSRKYFRVLRELKQRCNHRLGSERLRILSMGMSHDFTVAIEEGANIVRIGSALFGE